MPNGSRRITTPIAAGLVAVGLAAGGTVLSGCSTPAKGTAAEPPAKVASVAGSQVKQVTLTQRATERLGIQTVPLGEANVTLRSGGPSTNHKVVPYSALLYDVSGSTWVFARTGPLTYVRQPITVDHVDGERAVLVAGPPAGTDVVTVGAAVLYGTELGVGK
ncbi:MAG TPA: hypothetical protein VLJ59_11585 [Mycobacteriales bacterium]|nr:hypothetical protein [Mycobacteriales bacterium]